jgi:hypothetical protein
MVAAVATALAVGCTAGPAAPAHQQSPAPQHSPAQHSPAQQHSTASAAAPLTKFQACRQLLAVVTHQHGRATVPGLRRIADHVTDARMAGDARTAVRDIDHTGGAAVAFALLRDDCAHAGVRIPAP